MAVLGAATADSAAADTPSADRTLSAVPILLAALVHSAADLVLPGVRSEPERIAGRFLHEDALAQISACEPTGTERTAGDMAADTAGVTAIRICGAE